MDKNLDLEIATYQRHFIVAVASIVTLLKDKSVELEIDNKLNEKALPSHKKLRNTCSDIIEAYKDNDPSGHLGQMIKKAYKTLITELTFLKDKNPDLFRKKNDEGKINTIITGVNINLLINYLSEDEMLKVWQYIHIIFISSVKLVITVNKKKKEGDVWDLVLLLQKELASKPQSGISFNPYFGVQTNEEETNDFSVDQLVEGSKNIKLPEKSEGILGNLGIDKLLDKDKLAEELKNIDEKEINEATEGIAKLLGSSGDKDVTDVCDTLVRGIVDELKINGLQDIMKTASKVSEKVHNKLDHDKMKKTAMKMGDLMNNGENTLKGMKDKNGKGIGNMLGSMGGLKGPMQMAKMMGLDSGMLDKYSEMMKQMQKPDTATNDNVSKNEEKPKKKNK